MDTGRQQPRLNSAPAAVPFPDGWRSRQRDIPFGTRRSPRIVPRPAPHSPFHSGKWPSGDMRSYIFRSGRSPRSSPVFFRFAPGAPCAAGASGSWRRGYPAGHYRPFDRPRSRCIFPGQIECVSCLFLLHNVAANAAVAWEAGIGIPMIVAK